MTVIMPLIGLYALGMNPGVFTPFGGTIEPAGAFWGTRFKYTRGTLKVVPFLSGVSRSGYIEESGLFRKKVALTRQGREFLGKEEVNELVSGLNISL